MLLAFLAYALIAALANVGLQSLIDELKPADRRGCSPRCCSRPSSRSRRLLHAGRVDPPIRFVPVLMLQYAIQFIQLAVPSSAARVALEVRFFQRNGVETGGALSIGLIDSVSGFVIQILLILVITLSGLASLDLSGRLGLVEQSRPPRRDRACCSSRRR